MSSKGNFPLTFVLSVQGAEGVASKFNQVKSGLTGTEQAAAPLNKQLATTDQNLKKTGNSAGTVGQKLKGAKQPIDTATDSTKKLGTASTTTASKAEGLAGKFQKNKGMIFGLTMLSSGILEAVGMFSMYSDAAGKVSTAQDELNKVVAGGVTGTEQYQKQLIKVEAAQAKVDAQRAKATPNAAALAKAEKELAAEQAKLNEIVEGGVKGTDDYTKASDALSDAQRGLRFVQRNMILSMTDLIPMTLLVVSGLIGMKTAATEAATAQAAAGTATNGLTTASKALRIALMAIPLVAIATALIAIKTNAFGFRDALNELGAKVGAAIPGLKGFLNWVKDLGVAFGLTESKMDLSKAWDLLVSGFSTAFGKLTSYDWGSLLGNMVKTVEAFANDPGNWTRTGQAIMKGITGAIAWTNQYITPLVTKLATFVVTAAQNPSNWTKTGTAIMAGITAAVKWTQANVVPILADLFGFIASEAQNPTNWIKTGAAIMTGIMGVVKWTSENVTPIITKMASFLATAATTPSNWTKTGTAIMNGLIAAIAWTAAIVSPMITKLGAEISKQITTNGPTWWKGFQDALMSTAQWVGKGITAIGAGIAKTIVSQGPSWWKGFQDALASTAQWLGKGILAIGKGIIQTINKEGPKWWVGFQEALGASTQWVGQQMVKIGNAILDFDWASIGSGIWTAIVQGMQKALKTGGDILSQLNPFNFGGQDKNPFTPISNTGGGFGVPPGTIVNETGAPVGGGQQQGQPNQQQMTGLMGLIAKVQQAFATLSTSVATYSKSMVANMGIFFTKMSQAFPLLDTMVKAHQTTWSGFSTSLATYANSATTNVGVFFTKMGQAFPMLDQIIKTHQTTWSSFSTSLATYASSATTNVGVFFTKMGQAFPMLDGIIKAHQGTWSTFSTSVSTYVTSMGTKITGFATTSTSAMTKVASATKTAQSQLSNMSSSVSTYMSSMTSKVNSFGSSASSAFSKVTSQAKSATAAVKQLQSAINALKGKTITIRVNLSGPGVGYLEHGGGFIRHGQKGMSGIVDRPTTMNGVRMGEGFAPELVTVTPLTRGTGNHTGPTVSSGGGRGGGGGAINLTIPVILNNREFGRAVKQLTLEDIGLQV